MILPDLILILIRLMGDFLLEIISQFFNVFFPMENFILTRLLADFTKKKNS